MSSVESAVGRAEEIVAVYSDKYTLGGSYDELLGDLLADLMHYAAALQQDRELSKSFQDLVDIAEFHYEEEKE